MIVPAGSANFELWLAVIASGLYHGINPGMGWPLAVAAGLMERRAAALFSALGALAIGHFVAMAIVLLPFAILTMLAHLSRANSNRGGTPGHCVWLIPSDPSSSSARAGSHPADATCALVVCYRDCAWCRLDAGADLSWNMYDERNARYGTRDSGDPCDAQFRDRTSRFDDPRHRRGGSRRRR